MKILVTGANGFVGKNLVERLKAISEGKDKTRSDLKIFDLFFCTRSTTREELDSCCSEADFVFHLAGVNRPVGQEMYSENYSFTGELLDILRKRSSPCPVMFASSVQAGLTGRYTESIYGQSKLEAEKLVSSYGDDTGSKVMIYRFPNLFGKWCRYDYNSVVATFCHNIACGLPIKIDDPQTELVLLYIDDLVDAMLDALTGNICKDAGGFCCVPHTYNKTLGEISSLLYLFHSQPDTLMIPEIPPDSFEKKLYSTYLSYLPKEKVSFPFKMNIDGRGSFTELMKTEKCGQVSVNVTGPGITKGQHWHNTKWELFIVVSGHGLIKERKIGSDEVIEYDVSGEKMEAVYILPGYTHSITNLSMTNDLVAVMWASEIFDTDRPDTFREEV